jgi:hypothetical protein
MLPLSSKVRAAAYAVPFASAAHTRSAGRAQVYPAKQLAWRAIVNGGSSIANSKKNSNDVWGRVFKTAHARQVLRGFRGMGLKLDRYNRKAPLPQCIGDGLGQRQGIGAHYD